MRSLAIAFVIACSGPAAPPAITQPPPTPRVPAMFAKLFQRGAKWTFTTSLSTFEPQSGSDTFKETKTTGTLTCEVTYAGQLRARWETTLTCSATPALPYAFPVDLVATTTGLWQLDRDRPDAVLGPESRLIDVPPTTRQDYVEHPQAEGSRRSSVTNTGTRWCFGESFAMAGQIGGWSLCVRDGDLVGGTSEGNEGGNSRTMKWGEAE